MVFIIRNLFRFYSCFIVVAFIILLVATSSLVCSFTAWNFKYVYYKLFHRLGASNSSINPILYCYMNKKFRLSFMVSGIYRPNRDFNKVHKAWSFSPFFVVVHFEPKSLKGHKLFFFQCIVNWVVKLCRRIDTFQMAFIWIRLTLICSISLFQSRHWWCVALSTIKMRSHWIKYAATVIAEIFVIVRLEPIQLVCPASMTWTMAPKSRSYMRATNPANNPELRQHYFFFRSTSAKKTPIQKNNILNDDYVLPLFVKIFAYEFISI